MPPCYKSTQSAYPGMLRELPQRIDRQHLTRIQAFLRSGIIFIRNITAHYLPGSILEVEKLERSSLMLPRPCQPLFGNKWPLGILIDSQVIGYRALPWIALLPV